ncbi:PIN domain-containing protein [soil metagenome]
MVDSSAWIDYLRRGRGAISDTVDSLLVSGDAAICGMIELEILQGLGARERQRVSELFSALEYVETERRDYVFAGKRLGELRSRGVTSPSADVLVAAVCVRSGIPLLTSDKHFELIPEVERMPLEAG